MHKKTMVGLGALGIALGAVLNAQIPRLDLSEMVDLADDVVQGTIVGLRSFRVDSPVDGPELYYTTLTIEGQSLNTGTPTTVEVTYHGGFVSETEGVYNSEAPTKDDVRVGNEVVVFYRWADDMGGGVAANALCAAHGGLYRAFSGSRGTTVLGRGPGYAIQNNTMAEDLRLGLAALYRDKARRQAADEQGK